MKIENKVPSVEPQVVDALDAIQPITLKDPTQFTLENNKEELKKEKE